MMIVSNLTICALSREVPVTADINPGIANLIQNDPATSVIYADSFALAQDLVHFAFYVERTQ